MRFVFLVVLFASTAHADPKPGLELGLALGGHAFSSSSELGTPDSMIEPSPEAGPMIGARIAYPVALHGRLAVEGEAMVIPTEDDLVGDRDTVFALRSHLRFDVLTGRLRPFVVAGIGVQILRTDSPLMHDDADQTFHWGVGARWALNRKIDLRVDGRDVIVPDRSVNGATNELEVTAGVSYRFGSEALRPRPTEPPRPRPGDRDHDGIADDVDRCPNQPEDRDGFEDQDGCPDPDNDRDGITDAQDKCPNEPETKNGWKDDDGCPDQMLEELAGIGFEKDSAIIDIASAPLLERAYAIVHDNPGLWIEISGHTSSDGDPGHNFELSLMRAEAVKAYLVKRGIDAARILTLGHGSDVPVADNRTEDGRRKNRRIEFRIVPPMDPAKDPPPSGRPARAAKD